MWWCLAVKPQVFQSATREAAPALADHALVMSVAAGVPLAAVERWTRPDGRAAANRAVVRCMPNTPALVGAGITGLVANAHVTAAGREIAKRSWRWPERSCGSAPTPNWTR